MAKILFISDNFVNESLGIMYLSSYLKAHGHGVYLSLLSEYKRIDGLLGFIKDTGPDLIAFSVMTPQVNTFRPITKIIKENTHYRIIWGGPHCIFMPEHVLKNEYADIVCIGEGEEALLTLMNRIDARQDYSDIPSLWLKNGSSWIKNNIGHLEADLDKYPFPDRELYYSKYSLLRNFAVKRFITQRGCPYECSYCFEPMFKDLYRGKGRLIRRHSVNYVIGEIKEIVRRYPTKTVHFSDDTFNFNKEWVMDFLPKYKANINLPFTCNISVLNIDEETIKEFKNTGCNGIVFGLESGIENIRMNLLNKKIPNKRYVEVSELLRKYKLNFTTNLLFCLPNETLDDAIESIRFARSLKPYVVQVNILKIYKGTNLGKYVVGNNLCDAVGEFTYKAKDVNNEHVYIKNMIWAGYLFIKFPILINFAKGVLISPIHRLLKPIRLLHYWQDIKFFKIPLWQSWQYFWQSRKIFIGGIGKEQVDNNKRIKG